MSNLRSKILVVNDHGPSHFKPFEFLGLNYSRDHSIVNKDPDSVALVVFTGGSDVTPGLYGAGIHASTHSDIERDIVETDIINAAVTQGIPLAGICRGAQLLCVMAGGVLVQDITGHHGKHEIRACYPNGEIHKLLVSSDHHQMQYPCGSIPPDEYDILAWSEKPLSKYYIIDNKITVQAVSAAPELKREPDVVWYSKIKGLAAQYHPEWMRINSPGVKYFQELVEQYLVPLMEEDRVEHVGKKTA